MEILSLYEKASGQMLNVAKLKVFFSPNAADESKEEIMSTLGVQTLIPNDKYLGLPFLIGKSKRQILSYLKDRVVCKTKG